MELTELILTAETPRRRNIIAPLHKFYLELKDCLFIRLPAVFS